MLPLYKPGRSQWRGRARWKYRRIKAALRHGGAELSALPIVFANAIPKSGSKLLFNILRALESVSPFVDTGLNEIKPLFKGVPTSQEWLNDQLDSLRPGDLRFGYLYHHDETAERLCRPGWATFFLYRDPRDQLISEIFYALHMHRGHALHDFLSDLPDMPARIDSMTKGIPGERIGVDEHYARFTPWLKYPTLFPLRYEDLVQDREAALVHILERLKHAGYAPDQPDAQILEIMREAMQPARSETFRKGTTGGWREHFNQRNVEVFKEHSGDLLISLGYEEGYDW